MKIKADNNAVLQVFLDYYYPLWVKAGFSWELFPDLTLYININPTGGVGSTNAGREHYSPDELYVFAKIQSREELEALGVDFDIFIKALPSSLYHELGHHIHYKYLPRSGGQLWEKATELSGGKIGRDFSEQTVGGYWKIQAHEDFANYFDNLISGRVKNEKFLEWIRNLIGFKAVKLEPKDYIIKDGRSYIPVRLAAEELGLEVNWIEDTREIWVLGGIKIG